VGGFVKLDEFVLSLKESFPVGAVIDNPGGGTSTIAGCSESKVSYVRGKSKITVAFADLHDAYLAFVGKEVSSRQLKTFRPAVFDSGARPSGHNCNCTFLFRVLGQLGLSSAVAGSGVRNSPFSVKVRDAGV
jgi:hypothetical protein